ncbi:MAG: YebC/PmpR family DNA-binding transcriptional regulator [Chloroflexota bacterium]
MSGHSHWATIRRKKGAQDAKRGAIFTRLAREIVIAVREGGGDAGTNMRLQLAIDRARAQNMPKDNIERAIRRGTGDDKEGGGMEEVTFEGYGPHGAALIVDCVTDNRNRTIAEVRHTFSRRGGNMAEAGAVAWQFNRKAYFSFPASGLNYDKAFELAIEAGADDVIDAGETIEIIGPVESFKMITDALHAKDVIPEEAGLRMFAKQEMDLAVDTTLQVMRLIEALEDLDDVQDVYHNIRFSEEALAALEAE